MGVAVGFGVDVGEGAAVGSGAGVGMGVAVGSGVGIGVGAAVGSGVGVGVEVGVGSGVEVVAAAIPAATPAATVAPMSGVGPGVGSEPQARVAITTMLSRTTNKYFKTHPEGLSQAATTLKIKLRQFIPCAPPQGEFTLREKLWPRREDLVGGQADHLR